MVEAQHVASTMKIVDDADEQMLLEALLDASLPGFSQAMIAASMAKTPHAIISRAAAGILGQSIIINLPGSRKAVVENLAAVLPALPHALAKLQGDPADCGG